MGIPNKKINFQWGRRNEEEEGKGRETKHNFKIERHKCTKT
jgi:hypothetical protein